MTTKATKNAKGGGTIRKRSDGRWEARYTLGIDPKTGKQIQKSVYGKTQKEVRQKLTAITAEIDDGTYIPPDKTTVEQWLTIWLKEYMGDKKYGTVRNYKNVCKYHSLRHTYAVLCLQNGDDVKTVQSNLGHATAAFTLDVYGHVSEKMKQDSANRMEAYMRGTVYGKTQNG